MLMGILLEKIRKQNAADLRKANCGEGKENTCNFPDSFVSEILTLLDFIEIKEDSTLAKQRFIIAEKHGLKVEFSSSTSARLH